MRTSALPQARHNVFLLLFIFIHFEETTIQRNMIVIYIQRCLFSKYKRTEAYNLKRNILVISLFCNVSEQQ